MRRPQRATVTIIVGVALLAVAVATEPPALVSSLLGGVAFLLILGGAFIAMRSMRAFCDPSDGRYSGMGEAPGTSAPPAHHMHGGFIGHGGHGGGHHG
jgi:hypothetical protein